MKAIRCTHIVLLIALSCFAISFGLSMKNAEKEIITHETVIVEEMVSVTVKGNKGKAAAIGGGGGVVAGAGLGLGTWLLIGAAGLATGGTAYAIGAGAMIIGGGILGGGGGALAGAAVARSTYTDHVLQAVEKTVPITSIGPAHASWLCNVVIIAGFIGLVAGVILVIRMIKRDDGDGGDEALADIETTRREEAQYYCYGDNPVGIDSSWRAGDYGMN